MANQKQHTHQNFNRYDPTSAGGVVNQQFPNVYIYPWIPNTPVGKGTTRMQPHEKPAWFAKAVPRSPRNNPAPLNTVPMAAGTGPSKGTATNCGSCPNCSRECMGGVNSK